MEVADDFGETPLHLACRGEHVELVRWLYRQGASLDVRNADGARPIDLARVDGPIPRLKETEAAEAALEQAPPAEQSGHGPGAPPV